MLPTMKEAVTAHPDVTCSPPSHLHWFLTQGGDTAKPFGCVVEKTRASGLTNLIS